MATPCASGDTRWRDLLPLPRLVPEVSPPVELFKESVCAKRHRVRRQGNLGRANEVIDALNAMAGFKEAPNMRPTQNQQHAQSVLLGKVCSLPHPSERVFQREAIREGPSSPCVTGVDGTGGVVPCLVSLPECGAQPLDATSLIYWQGREVLEKFESTMLKDMGDSPQPIKNMDEVLRSSPQAYHEFILELYDRGMRALSWHRAKNSEAHARGS